MSNISISLPDDLSAYINQQIVQAGYASMDEYFLNLVQRDLRRSQAKDTLDSLLLEGLDSLDRQEGFEATDDWWDQERQDLIENFQG